MTDATIDYLVEYLSKSNKFSCRVSLDKLSNNNKLEDKKKKEKNIAVDGLHLEIATKL